METPGQRGEGGEGGGEEEEGGEDRERKRETDILHDVLPHPQTLLLHLHHVVLLVLGVVDLLQLQGDTHKGTEWWATGGGGDGSPDGSSPPL